MEFFEKEKASKRKPIASGSKQLSLESVIQGYSNKFRK